MPCAALLNFLLMTCWPGTIQLELQKLQFIPDEADDAKAHAVPDLLEWYQRCWSRVHDRKFVSGTIGPIEDVYQAAPVGLKVLAKAAQDPKSRYSIAQRLPKVLGIARQCLEEKAGDVQSI